eukprot:TRINITY_DN2930_c0_g1_i1.p1 TRINITY_DN2930_c0_g1~~TRINITY_DN2930_c0_g1_i1.p1  ORF type:complete len:152 (-),score=29.52 TRINITY_DN2930_c0_g1_i1:80-535(-)
MSSADANPESIKSAARKALTKRDVHYLDIGEILHAPYKSRTGDFHLIVTAKHGYVCVKIRLENNVPEEKRELAAEFAARVNFSKHISNGFSIDLNDGEFGLEMSAPATNSMDLDAMLTMMIDFSLRVWNLYIGNFQQCMTGSLDVANATRT